LRAFHARRALNIPEQWRISGEYLYARHSLPYTRELGNPLRSFFYGFGVWDNHNDLLDWDTSIDVMAMLDIEPVPVLYDGPFRDDIIEGLAASMDTTRQEGFVMRLADKMPYPVGVGASGRFFDGIAKWVRAEHVTADRHWMAGPVIPNELASGISASP
jgi:hypothetical protein